MNGAHRIPLRRAALASSVLVAILSTQTLAQEAERERWEGDPRERAEWLRRRRGVVEGDEINPVVRTREATQAGLRSSLVALSPWRSVGPFGFITSGFYASAPQMDGGRVRAVAVHPTNPSIVYAGSASGGVWRTTNAGATWTPLTDKQCSLTTGGMALDPVNPNIVYIGTGEPTQSSGCGLLRSTDGGTSWAEINGGGVLAPTNGRLGNSTYRLRVDRETAGSTTSTVVLYAATNGLHRSTTSGTSWSTALTGVVSDVVCDPATPSLCWAARVSGTRGLYRSNDKGATWALEVAFDTRTERAQLAVSPAAPGRVWMLEIVSARFQALRTYAVTTGRTESRRGDNLYNSTTRADFGEQGWYNLVLEIDPQDANVVVVGGVRLYRSRDGGNTFSLMAYDVHSDWHAFVYAPSDPDIIVGGCDGGVFMSTDRGDSWLSRNANMVTTQFYPGLAVHPTLPDVLAGGLQDNSSIWSFGSSFWTMSGPHGDGGYGGFNQQNPTVFWSSGYTPGRVFRHSWSSVGGLSSIYRGFDFTNERKAFLPPVVIDPNDGATLYYATQRLWRTNNEGLSWSPITGDLSKGSGWISTVAVSPADSRVVWVGTSDGLVHVTQDGGATWQQVATGIPDRYVTQVLPDPLDRRRAITLVSGRGTGHVFVTTSLGAAWQDISTGLPDIGFASGAFVPGTTKFFAAADVGVYATDDNGASWSAVGAPLPNVTISDLVYQRATGLLYVATYGRGIWAATVQTGPAILRGDVDGNGAVNAFDAALVQQALTGVRPSINRPPLPNGDANCNGALDIGDVLAILQFSVGAAPTGACVGTIR
jgi:photosystem II stability/assembly factor-like uncharacterized protein